MYEAKKNALNVLVRMVAMQDGLNERTRGADWASQELNWGRAIWTEAAEAMGHIGWEWWKNTARNEGHLSRADMAHLRLELIDILHFGISLDLVDNLRRFDYVGNKDELQSARYHDIAGELLRKMEHEAESKTKESFTVEGMARLIENLADSALRGAFYKTGFLQAAAMAGMDHAQIAAYYLGKNLLNTFRQENGYKAGTYIKNWNGQEDNLSLAYILEEYFRTFNNADHIMKSLQSGEFDAYVRKELHDTYVRVKGNE